MHADHIYSVNYFYVELYRELGYCEFPLYISTDASEELFQLRNLVRARHVDCPDWARLSGTAFPRWADLQLADFCCPVARNIDKDYPRSLGRRADRSAAHKGPAKLPDGAAVDGPE